MGLTSASSPAFALTGAAEAMDPPPLRATARTKILALLETRLHYAQVARLYPEIVAQDVGDPLIVCGLPRHRHDDRL